MQSKSRSNQAQRFQILCITYACTAAVEEPSCVLHHPGLVPVIRQPRGPSSGRPSVGSSLKAGPAPRVQRNARPFRLGRLCWGRLGGWWLVAAARRNRLGFLIAVKSERILQAISGRPGPLGDPQDRVVLGSTTALGAHLGLVGGVTPFGTEGASLGGQNLVKLGRALSSLAAVGFTESGCHCCIWVIFSKTGRHESSTSFKHL